MKTKHYKVAPGKYLGAISITIIERYWWLIIIPIACFVYGFIDWRWIAAGLIFLMLIYPAAMTTALLSHGLRPEIIRRSSSNLAEIKDGEITIYKAEINDKGDIIQYRPIETLKIDSEIQSGKFVKYKVGKNSYDFILIPSEALSQDNRQEP